MKDINNTLDKHDNKFDELEKKVKEILGNREIDTVKEDTSKISEELKVLKSSLGEILNRLNQQKAEIEEIANDIKEQKENDNFNKNMASIDPGVKPVRKRDDTAQIEQMQEDLDDLKHYIESKLMDLDIKIDIISNSLSNPDDIKNLKNKNISSDDTRNINIERMNTKLKTLGPSKFEFSKSSGGMIGLPQLMKRIDDIDKNHRDLERSFKRLLSSFNLNDVLDDIAKLKETKANKADIPDQDSFNYLLDDIKTKIKKFEAEIKDINQKIDGILSKLVNQDNNNNNKIDQSFGGININKEILQAFLSKEEFENYSRQKNEELNIINKDLQKIKEYLSQIADSIDKKVDINDLNNTKGFLIEKIEDLARACNLKFADKNECLKNFKHIEEQLKKILSILKKRNTQNSEGEGNWLLAKKPIKGYSCAACESYIGELNNDIRKYIPWNKMPLRDSSDVLYRMGNGYSKMLQMINFDNSGNVNIIPDVYNDDVNTIVSNDSNAINTMFINGTTNNSNSMNIMGKTFYPKQKVTQSKTPGKIRIQSAYNIFGEKSNNNINSKNNNNLEENKNNWNVINNNFNNKTRNQKGLPKLNYLEGETGGKNDPKIIKIMKKSQSKSNIKQFGSKF